MKNAVSKIISKNVSLRDSDFIKALFGKSYDEFVNQGSSVIIYGAGSAGLELSKLLELHDIHTLYFCDKNDDLIGTKIFGKEIISPSRLAIEFKNYLVIVGIQNNKEEAINFLRKVGITSIRFIDNAEQFFYYLQFPKWKISLATIKNDSELINTAYELLCDDKSRHIYINRLAILSSFADYKSYKENCILTDCPVDLPIDKRIFSWYFENQMYFNNDLIDLADGFCLVDCGAYNGDSFIEFHKAMSAKNLLCGKSYCFEPDTRNYQSLESNLTKYENVSLFNIGCYDDKKILEFANSELMHVTEAFIVENGKDKVIHVAEGNDFVEVDTIDNLVFPNRVDVIKMDVEGSEAKALKGAVKTIKMHHPVLIISAYHKIGDLYNIVLLIKDISPAYKIYLRQFSFSWSETVLIAKS